MEGDQEMRYMGDQRHWWHNVYWAKFIVVLVNLAVFGYIAFRLLKLILPK